MKKNNNLNNKLIKILLILFIVLCLILGITVVFLKKELYKNNAVYHQNYIYDDEQWNDEEYPYMGYMLFVNYKGDLSSNNITKSMYYVANELIPKYYLKLKNSSQVDIESFYEKNKNSIVLELGIETAYDFYKIIEKMQNNFSKDNLIFKGYAIEADTIKVKNNYTDAVLQIKYNDDQKIFLNVRIYNSINKKRNPLIYTLSSKTSGINIIDTNINDKKNTIKQQDLIIENNDFVE